MTGAASSSVLVAATANSGYTFTNWTANGTVQSTSPYYTFTLATNLNLLANFTVNPVPLTITSSGNQAMVSWPSSATGWTLQTNGDLSTGNWVNYGGAVVNNTVTTSLPAGNLFFRLTHP